MVCAPILQAMRTYSGDGHTEQKRKGSDNPRRPDLVRHVADSLHDALQYADVLLADRDQKRERCANVQQSGQDARPGYGSWQKFAGDSRSHRPLPMPSSKPTKAEADHAKRVQQEARVRRDLKIGGSYGRSEAEPNDKAEADQDRSREKSSYRAEIVDPLSYAQSDDVEHH